MRDSAPIWPIHFLNPFYGICSDEGDTLVNTVEVSGLVKRFSGLTAVDNISFSVEKGEIFGLLGPNGAGKTTTVKILITLLKPTNGKVMVAGYDALSQPNEVRSRIGYVPQESALDARLTARENLELFAKLYSVPKKDIEPRILQVLKLVELESRMNDLVAHFSGGMKRRLEIARGLLSTPDVLFLDEPTAGLDPQTRRVVWDFIHKLQHEWGLTILATTHYLEEAEHEMGRVAIIDKGKIMAMGKPDDLKAAYGRDLIDLTINISGEGFRDDRLLVVLSELNLGSEISVHGENIKVAAANGKKALPFIIHKIESIGLEIDSISVRSPTLDDVFIKYTGRGIREEDGAGETKKHEARMIGRMRSRI